MGPHQTSGLQLFAPPRAGPGRASLLGLLLQHKPESLLLVPPSTGDHADLRGLTTGRAYALRKGHKICTLKIYLSFTIALLVVVSGGTPLIILALSNIPNQNVFIYLTQMSKPFPPKPGRKHFVAFLLCHLDGRALLISRRADEEHQACLCSLSPPEHRSLQRGGKRLRH